MNKKMLAGFASLTLIAVLLPAMPAQAQSSAYFQAMTNLNPAGYWPMHEVEAPAQGDIETNYGTLGLLGTGYYPNWMGAPGFILQKPGALAPGDTDPAVCFTETGGSGTGATNALYVPHTSPLSTLKPPFSVECWLLPSNNAAGDFWSQNGYEGLNAGANGGGGGNYAGIRLSWSASPAGLVIYTYDAALVSGNQTIGSQRYIPTNQWSHVVITCNASTNFSMYTNGVLATSGSAAGKYSPDYWMPFEVGNGRGNTRAGCGTIDEVAVYTNVLSTSDILAHYAAGTNASPSPTYFQLVTNDNPVIYLRMDSSSYAAPAFATWPALTNYGSVVGNGTYTPGTMPGIVPGPVSPNGMPFVGLSVASGTNVAQFSGVSSFADVGSSSVFNPTGQVPFVVTAMFRGNPCDGRTQTIVGQGGWSIYMNTSGKLVSSFGTNSSGSVTSSNVYNDGNWHQVVAAYLPDHDFGAGAYGTNALFVDGVVAGGGLAVNGFGLGTNLDAMIGADPQYTNNPAGVGRQFAGQVCEVAIFTNVLTLAQVQALYNVSGVAPSITTQPVSGSVNQGAGFTNTVVASGSQPLAYQWYTNSVALPNQTNASLILNPVLPSYASTNYYVVVTNSLGSVTSAVVSLTVFSSPIIVSQLPAAHTNVMTLFAGASPTFSISAIGAPPLHYFWVTNGVVVAGATGTNYTLINVQAISPTNFYCIVSNIAGTATSTVWTVSVISDPTAPYPVSVLAAHPIGYWRLNERPDDGNGDQGVICNDYLDGNNGIYANVILGLQGYSVTDPETSTEFGEEGPIVDSDAWQIAGIDFSSPTNTSATFSVEAWVNGYSSGQSSGGLVSKGYGNGGEQFDLDLTTASVFRFFVRDAGGGLHSFVSTFQPDNNWHHLVGVCDESNGVVSLYIDGVLAGSSSIQTNAGILTATNLMIIGSRMSVANTNNNDQFFGYMNDVAVYNYALSASQVAAQYVSSGIPPIFIQMPPTNNVTINAGATLVIPALAIGTTPLTNTWYDVTGNTTVATGSTNALPLNATLTVANVPAGWNNETLRLTVANLYGSTNITVTVNVVSGAPQIVADIAPLQWSGYAGGQLTLTLAAYGTAPLYYQWYQNGTGISGATNSSYTATVLLGANTYSCSVSNTFGGGSITNSSTATVVGFSASTANSYSQLVLSDSPIAYWRLDEPAGSTIAYDYVGGYNGTYGVNTTNGLPGVSAPGFAGELGVAMDNSVATTNGYVTTPGVNLNTNTVTFTCWVFPFTTQNNPSGLVFCRSGSTVAGSQIGGSEALDYTWNNLSSTYNYGSGLTVPPNMWSLVALTITPSNAVLYVFNANGQSSATNAVANAVQSFSGGFALGADPQTQAPPTRVFNGEMDEVAIFNYSLSASQLSQLYSASQVYTPTISVSRSETNATDVTITYIGTLLSSTNVTGLYTTNSVDGASSPYTTPATNAQQFYRSSTVITNGQN